jgi:hypothetical protein
MDDMSVHFTSYFGSAEERGGELQMHLVDAQCNRLECVRINDNDIDGGLFTALRSLQENGRVQHLPEGFRSFRRAVFAAMQQLLEESPDLRTEMNGLKISERSILNLRRELHPYFMIAVAKAVAVNLAAVSWDTCRSYFNAQPYTVVSALAVEEVSPGRFKFFPCFRLDGEPLII